MLNYILRRLLLLPLTLFCIVLVNFVIINLAPGDPVSVTEISPEGTASRREDGGIAFGSDERYLHFREHYGLTLPILFNPWPLTSLETVEEMLWQLVHKKKSPEATEEMDVKSYDNLRIAMGDRARFVMPHLVQIMDAHNQDPTLRRMAARFFVRGATRQAVLGPDLTQEQKGYNRKISHDHLFLRSIVFSPDDSVEMLNEKTALLTDWYKENKAYYNFTPDKKEIVHTFFFETRFFRYLGRVVTFDFGTLRNDPNKTVISEVTKRFKYSLTLAFLPMLVTFFLCQVVGFTMAYRQGRWQDYSLNLTCLILYAIPVFVVAPFLIEKVALNHTFPFTDIPIPISGFTSPSAIYEHLVSYQRIFDTMQHIFLPLVAIIYGSLAAQARLSRTAVLEVMRHDYVRTAKAKGLGEGTIMVKHVGRNAAITIVTSIASSLGIILGGSLIVETLFEINGFGKFFYDAIVNRDYNVIMFSALAGAFLSLVGYLIADLAYTFLDPRVTLD